MARPKRSSINCFLEVESAVPARRGFVMPPRCTLCGRNYLIAKVPRLGTGVWVCPTCDRGLDMAGYQRGICRHWDHHCPHTTGGGA